MFWFYKWSHSVSTHLIVPPSFLFWTFVFIKQMVQKLWHFKIYLNWHVTNRNYNFAKFSTLSLGYIRRFSTAVIFHANKTFLVSLFCRSCVFLNEKWLFRGITNHRIYIRVVINKNSPRWFSFDSLLWETKFKSI